jgi:hypothetical protein
MILYNVTINIDNACHDEWLQWMKSKHIPDLMATGYFIRNNILRLLNEEDNGGVTYAFQYYLQTLEDLNNYEKTHEAFFQAEHQERYRDKYVSFRTVLEVVD